MTGELVLDGLRDRARQNPQRVIFPEASDPRVICAANEFQTQGLGQAVVVDPPSESDLCDDVEVVQSDHSVLREQCVEQLIENRKHKGMDQQRAETALDDPLLFAALLVNRGFVSGCVAGSLATTANVIRAGIYGVGMAADTHVVSSFFLMQLPDRALTYADCGVVPDPTSEQLAEIAIQSAASHHILTGELPRVAMLSFSTKGSAQHERVDKVTNALSLVRQKSPDLLIDGELQFDAAFDAKVAERKAPDSQVAGKANVFIFPDLDSGNIAYKITERLASAIALGPLVQGLAKPCMDLSRGCKSSDIVDVAVIAGIMAFN